ncbi:transposase [Spirulina major]|uniref:transposase n=1 Tax=Spirulina major TaxID=270636 RepID=UPI0009340513|nr:transposase [Spirulina major]
MKYNPKIHHRQSIRLRGYDYTQPGAYFVTICTYKKQCWFGEVRNGTMYRNQIGNLVAHEWLKSPQIRDNVKLDAWVVMPNHLHGIVWLLETKTRRGATLAPRPCATPHQGWGRSRNELGSFIAGFKSSVTRQINQLREHSELPIWQRNYYETIIRDDTALHSIRNYIQQNPEQWLQDKEHPQRHTEFTKLSLDLVF